MGRREQDGFVVVVGSGNGGDFATAVCSGGNAKNSQPEFLVRLPFHASSRLLREKTHLRLGLDLLLFVRRR